jgi:hypothetical protein
MALSEQALREFLAQHNLPHESLHLLWEIRGQNVYGILVWGGEAIEQWITLRQKLDAINYYPLLVGDEDEIGYHLDCIEDLSDDSYQFISMEELIQEVTNTNSDQWLIDRAQYLYEDRQEWDTVELGEPLTVLTKDILGEWRTDIVPSNDFSIPYNHQRQPIDRMVIALIPTQTGWHIPAYLNFGAWNDCPDPLSHMVMMKRWQEQYGAEVVGITHDVVEMRVSNPPLDQYQALTLAQEQYLYCSDIVEQGTQTLSVLAGVLLEGSAWYFWWD